MRIGAALLVAAIAVGGCRDTGLKYVKSEGYDHPTVALAVLPLADRLGGLSVGSGEIVSNHLAIRFQRKTQFEIVDRDRTVKAYRAEFPDFSSEPKPEIALRIGRSLGAGAVVAGQVTHWEKFEERDVQAGAMTVRWKIGATIKLYSCKDGGLLYQASYTTRYDPDLPMTTMESALDTWTEMIVRPILPPSKPQEKKNG